MRRPCFSLPILLLLSSTLAAADTTDAAHWNVEVEAQVVVLPQAAAAAIVSEFKDESKANAAHEKLQAMIAAKTARLVGWLIVTGRSGERVVAESIDEFRYASEYTPPAVGFLPSLVGDEPIKIQPKVDVTAFEAAPSEFETRSTGVTVEFEPVVLEAGAKLGLNIVLSHVRLKGMTRIVLEKPETEVKVAVEQPRFENHRVTTGITVRNGQRVLLSVLKMTEPVEEVEIFTFKGEAKKIE